MPSNHHYKIECFLEVRVNPETITETEPELTHRSTYTNKRAFLVIFSCTISVVREGPALVEKLPNITISQVVPSSHRAKRPL